MKNAVLVTGGAGYIGSHTCKALSQVGYTPVAYDNLVYGHRQAVRWGPMEKGDISDRGRLEEVISRYKPRAVVHFAAYAYVGESVREPSKYYRNNVAGSLTLLEVMRGYEINSLVFSSTCATYGLPQSAAISEDHPQQPINPYGASKLMIERMLKDFDQAYDFRHVALRYFNAAGADPEGDIGENHEPETHLIPLVIQTALGKRSHVDIYGADYETPDGTAVRDYIHVTDLAKAHVQALKYLERGRNSVMLNLGVGRGCSVREVIRCVEAVTGKSISVREMPKRAGDPPILVADARRADEILGWRPVCSGLEDIVDTAWRWHSRHE
ncbi:MAG: UDP-glucose 4-epimerase GalE [Gammaproteobacteria bacterium]|nr:UDP-glucose 4-epimerase GalE [Gammaproteobacteria bacterium]